MEIERKFLVKTLPDLSDVVPIKYERYYLNRGGGMEERITKKDNIYEYEVKNEISNLERTNDKKRISKDDFDKLKVGRDGLVRDGYQLKGKPNTSIKIYHGRFEGLVRAEVEFDSVIEARSWVPEFWMGEEITDSPLGRDSRLLDLSGKDFKLLVGK